jgi:AraC family transcriptional regulator, transcriptional activator of the genes for pyochelin and ferripyochelin receptors
VPYPLKISSADKEALLSVKLLLEADASVVRSLPEMCKHSGLNADKLKKGFKILYGVPPHRFQIDLRMKEAQRLLVSSDMSIAEIAWTVGYEHADSFCRAFKQYTGMRALQYKRKIV